MATGKIKYFVLVSNLLFAFPAVADYAADEMRFEMNNAQAASAAESANAFSQQMHMEQARAVQQDQFQNMQRQIDQQQQQLNSQPRIVDTMYGSMYVGR